MFKIGDRVRCVRAHGHILKIGNVYTVTSIEEDIFFNKGLVITLKEVGDPTLQFYADRFQKIESITKQQKQKSLFSFLH